MTDPCVAAIAAIRYESATPAREALQKRLAPQLQGRLRGARWTTVRVDTVSLPSSE